MGKSLACGDVMPGCNFVAKGATEQEVLQLAGKHAAEKHGLNHPPPEVLAKVKAAIKDT